MTTNDEIASRLEEMADLLEARDVEYKPRAYRRAAENVRSQTVRVADVAEDDPDALEEIEGVGDAIADKIAEFVEIGEIGELEDLREELPVDMAALTRVEGVGPKTVGKLYEALGITSLDELEAAAEAGEIQDVKGFGAKTEENILENVEFAREAGERQLLGAARPIADEFLEWLEDQDPIERCEVAGSLRRWKPTIGDIDVLVASSTPEDAVDAFTAAGRVDEVIESGTTKAAVRAGGIRVDLRVVDPGEYGSALQYFTGSKEHNVRLRTYALDRGITLNEYGAFDVSTVDADDPDATRARREGERLAGETEASMYEVLDLPLVPPEMREDRGEIAAAEAGELPDLLTVDDVRGDLHTHTDWSDGNDEIAEMIRAAADFGHDYYCIADHATGPGVVGGTGLDDEEIREQVGEIRDAAEAVDGVEVFAGIEANIDADGGISVGDDVLADLDLVVASPHSGLDGTDDATDRLIAAMEHPSVDVLGHPTGRLINQRSGLTIDPGRLGAAAAENGVALEVNSYPPRLDLSGGAVKDAVEAGATVAVNTDAHSPGDLHNVRYGVHTARRGWAEADDVLNAWSVDEVRAFLH